MVYAPETGAGVPQRAEERRHTNTKGSRISQRIFQVISMLNICACQTLSKGLVAAIIPSSSHAVASVSHEEDRRPIWTRGNGTKRRHENFWACLKFSRILCCSGVSTEPIFGLYRCFRPEYEANGRKEEKGGKKTVTVDDTDIEAAGASSLN